MRMTKAIAASIAGGSCLLRSASIAVAAAGVTLGLSAAVAAAESSGATLPGKSGAPARSERVRTVTSVAELASPKSIPAAVQELPQRYTAKGDTLVVKPSSPGKGDTIAPAPLKVERVKAVRVDLSTAPQAPAKVPASKTEVSETASLSSQQAPSPPAAKPVAAEPAEDDVEPGEIMWLRKPARGGPTKTASLSPMNLGTPGKPMEMEAPVKDGKFHLGDVTVRIEGEDVSVNKERLLEILKPLLREPALEKLKGAASDGEYIKLASLSMQNFDIRFDTGQVELQVNPTIDQRARGHLSANNRGERIKSESLSQPAALSGYLNVRAGADYTTSKAFTTEDATERARADFEGAARWMNTVMESRATMENDGTFSRRGTRFVYDMPEDAMRYSAGDVAPLRTSYQGGSDLLGLSVEKSYQKLQPGKNIHPTGSHSFRIERSSDVDVMINGHVTQRLQLRPGDYDINDLPLTAGANDISLVITDDVGNKRTLQFTVFSGRSLLAPDISEWALSAGIATRYNPTEGPEFANLYSQMEYDFGTPVVTGYYQRGLTENLTGEVHLQGDTHVLMGGAGAFFQTAFGFFGIDVAASHAVDAGPGVVGHITYDLANIECGDGIKRSFRLAGEYRSEQFAAINTLNPRNDTMLTVSTSYSQELPWKLSGSLSAGYSIVRDSEDHYGADLNLARNFGPALSASLSLGYDHSATPTTRSRLPEGVKALIRLNYRVSENSSLDSGYDARDGRSQVSYRHQEGNGVGSWNAQVEVEHEGGSVDGQDNIGLNGSLGYIGNRVEVAISQHTGFVGFDGGMTSQRTSITAGTAIAFADGAVAVGRPVTNSFGIIEPHANLPESTVTVGSSKDTARAASDFLGPALLPDVSPYSPSRVPIDVDNLPVGYDLGTGGFDLLAPYKSGYHFTVGSDYTVTAFGTLTDGQGEPIPLLTGVAFEEAYPSDHRVTVFTNKAGRFGAQGLRPGRWVIEMATEPKTRFSFDVPKDTVGLLRLDTLKPINNGT